jgi:single-stranded-DNA-specific exonuclease
VTGVPQDWRRRKVSAAPGLAASQDSAWFRLYAARGVQSAADLCYDLDTLPDPESLLGMRAAVDVLARAIEGDRRIVVVADYDCDGATACAIALRGLARLGATRLDFVVPDRAIHGYGLTPALVAVAALRAPAVLLTVDNGIASCEGVAEANRRGFDVVITDHHLPGSVLPEAAATVNPNQPGDASGLRCLAGCGVMFLVLLALRRRLWANERPALPPLADLLPLVALGTVADVVPLDRLNRLLVDQGLRRLREGRAPVGMLALTALAKRPLAALRSSDLGFALGPRLNAAGRLDDMAIGIRCLVTDDPQEAQHMAATLDGLNRARRDLQAQMQEQAEADLFLRELGQAPEGVCVFREQWHAGVVGIIAGRLKDRLGCPVIAFAPGGGGELRGSARSVPGVHIRDVLATVNAWHPGLITRFGGHAMAAGLTLPDTALPAFEQALLQAIVQHGGRDIERGVLWTDGPLEAEHCAPGFVARMEREPWGQGFPEPLFETTARVLHSRVLKQSHVRLELELPGGLRLPAIGFGLAETRIPKTGDVLDFACRPGFDEYGPTPRVQLRIEALRDPARTAS